MYALPNEIYKQQGSVFEKEEISRILSLALIAHKYQFLKLESWARGVLDCHSLPASRARNAIDFPNICTEEEFIQLVRFAVLAEHSTLKDVVSELLLKRVDEKPRTFDIVRALNLSEGYGWRQLQGEIYYRIVCETAKAASANAGNKIFTMSAFRASLPSGLTDVQNSNVMEGYFTLIVTADRIMEATELSTSEQESVNENHRDYGYHNGTNWAATVKSFNIGAVRHCVAVDVLGRLQQMIKDIDDTGGSVYLQTLRNSLTSTLVTIKAGLAEYFLGEEEIR